MYSEVGFRVGCGHVLLLLVMSVYKVVLLAFVVSSFWIDESACTLDISVSAVGVQPLLLLFISTL